MDAASFKNDVKQWIILSLVGLVSLFQASFDLQSPCFCRVNASNELVPQQLKLLSGASNFKNVHTNNTFRTGVRTSGLGRRRFGKELPLTAVQEINNVRGY